MSRPENTVVEFTTPMSEKELKVAIAQEVAHIAEKSNAIGRQIAQEDCFFWVNHPFNNITYEDREISVKTLPYYTGTDEFSFRIVDGKIQQYATIRMTFVVSGQVKGESMTSTDATEDLEIEGVRFEKTRTRQGTVYMDFVGESYTFVFLVALKGGMVLETREELMEAYRQFGMESVKANWTRLDSKRGFHAGIVRIKKQHTDLLEASEENTFKAIALLYDENKARQAEI